MLVGSRLTRLGRFCAGLWLNGNRLSCGRFLAYRCHSGRLGRLRRSLGLLVGNSNRFSACLSDWLLYRLTDSSRTAGVPSVHRFWIRLNSRLSSDWLAIRLL